MKSENHQEILLTHFEWSLSRFEEMLQQNKSDYFRDAALQRFGFTFDLAVKCIRAFAAAKNLTCESIRDCFTLAAQEGWLGEERAWGKLIDAHHKINPKPEPAQADELFGQMDDFYGQFKDLRDRLTRSLQNI
jgi:hypothetical protein